MATRIVTFLGLGSGRFPERYEPVRYRGEKGIHGPTALHDVPTIAEAEGPVTLVVLGTVEVEQTWFASDLYLTLLRRDLGPCPMPLVRLVVIPKGASTEERWEIFEQLVALVDPDRPVVPGEVRPTGIVVDITHGFRSQPFFAAAAIAFAQSERRRRWTEAKSPAVPVRIAYAAYEPSGGPGPDRGQNATRSDAPAEQVVVPIWDLTQFLDVLRWNTALDGLLRHGRADDLAGLLEGAEKEARPRAASAEDHKEIGKQIGPLSRFRKAASAFAEGLVTVRVPALITELAGRLTETARDARDILGQRAKPVVPMLDHMVETVQQLVAPSVVSPEGLRASVHLARLYARLQRYSELSALIRETYVSGFTLLRADDPVPQPGEGSDFNARRKADDRALGGLGKALQSGYPGHFNAFTGLRNDVQHGGFRSQGGKPDVIRKRLDAAVDQLESHLQEVGLFGPTPGVFASCSNHPSTGWTPEQHSAALALGHGAVVDVPFPAIPPDAAAEDVARLAQRAAGEILSLPCRGAFVAGEHSATFAIVHRLQAAGIPCYVATTGRVASEVMQADGTVLKTSAFRFVAWRPYPGGAQ